jgi:hypothetical protein
MHAADSFKNYHDTQTAGAQASVVFNGTGIWLFGSKASDHGSYEIIEDGQSRGTQSSSNRINLYNQVLYSGVDLPIQQHEVILKNAEGKRLDFDYGT